MKKIITFVAILFLQFQFIFSQNTENLDSIFESGVYKIDSKYSLPYRFAETGNSEGSTCLILFLH